MLHDVVYIGVYKLVLPHCYSPFPKAPFTLHRYSFCTGTEGVTVHLRLHCSGAEVVPDSPTVYTVPVAFVSQIAVLLLSIVKEQKCISLVLTTRHSIARSFFPECPSGFIKFFLNYTRSKRNQLRGSRMLRASSNADTFILQLETRTTYFQII